jgi:hypothetical protein
VSARGHFRKLLFSKINAIFIYQILMRSSDAICCVLARHGQSLQALICTQPMAGWVQTVLCWD